MYMGPDSLAAMLKDLGWTLEDKPSESRSRMSPWKIFGVAPSDDEKFSYDAGEKYLFIVPWKNRRRDEDVESKKLAGRRYPGKRNAVGAKLVSPAKKKLKTAAPKGVGGIQGPSKGTRVLDCGGCGDCEWRAAGYILACHNAKWPSDTSEIRGKTMTIGAALRASCISWLLNVNHDWEESLLRTQAGPLRWREDLSQRTF